ncbi:MAG: hypothetical protein ACYDDF_11550 [Thermoplasmatota archaeon]
MATVAGMLAVTAIAASLASASPTPSACQEVLDASPAVNQTPYLQMFDSFCGGATFGGLIANWTAANFTFGTETHSGYEVAHFRVDWIAYCAWPNGNTGRCGYAEQWDGNVTTQAVSGPTGGTGVPLTNVASIGGPQGVQQTGSSSSACQVGLGAQPEMNKSPYVQMFNSFCGSTTFQNAIASWGSANFTFATTTQGGRWTVASFRVDWTKACMWPSGRPGPCGYDETWQGNATTGVVTGPDGGVGVPLQNVVSIGGPQGVAQSPVPSATSSSSANPTLALGWTDAELAFAAAGVCAAVGVAWYAMRRR